MNRIAVAVTKETCSCNNCSARNYKSKLSFDNNEVDKIYELQVSSMCIYLCKDCLEKLYWHISDFMGETK